MAGSLLDMMEIMIFGQMEKLRLNYRDIQRSVIDSIIL